MSLPPPFGHRSVLQEWRAGISVSDLGKPRRLVLVDRNDARCDTCGRPIARGDEAYRGFGRALMHTGCAYITGGPRGS